MAAVNCFGPTHRRKTSTSPHRSRNFKCKALAARYGVSSIPVFDFPRGHIVARQLGIALEATLQSELQRLSSNSA